MKSFSHEKLGFEHFREKLSHTIEEWDAFKINFVTLQNYETPSTVSFEFTNASIEWFRAQKKVVKHGFLFYVSKLLALT